MVRGFEQCDAIFIDSSSLSCPLSFEEREKKGGFSQFSCTHVCMWRIQEHDLLVLLGWDTYILNICFVWVFGK